MSVGFVVLSLGWLVSTSFVSGMIGDGTDLLHGGWMDGWSARDEGKSVHVRRFE